MVHALSVDVEDWYHDWLANGGAGVESRVERNTLYLLDLLQRYNARATFFFLGQVAQRFPALVRRVAAAGHELGSHGDRHRPVTHLTRREFREDVRRSLQIIQDAAGLPVHAYRAPYFSIKADVSWPIEILGDLGLRYDSSVLPIDRIPGLELVCPRTPFRHANGLWEMPVAVLQVFYFWHLPLASGAGLRHVPLRRLRPWVCRFERDVGAGVFYLHPWELDPESPTAPYLSRRLLRVGRRRLPERLAALLRERTFAPIGEVFAHCLTASGEGMEVGHAPPT